MQTNKNKNIEYEDLLPVRYLSFKEILYLTIVCMVLTILISAVISIGIFRVRPFDDLRVFSIGMMTGGTISYALGNYTIYKYYRAQEKKKVIK